MQNELGHLNNFLLHLPCGMICTTATMAQDLWHWHIHQPLRDFLHELNRGLRHWRVHVLLHEGKTGEALARHARMHSSPPCCHSRGVGDASQRVRTGRWTRQTSPALLPHLRRRSPHRQTAKCHGHKPPASTSWSAQRLRQVKNNLPGDLRTAWRTPQFFHSFKSAKNSSKASFRSART